MVPNANARHFMLKAAQRDLIAAAGGIERAAAVCSFGKSTVGRWANGESPELMPLEAIFALEEETGRHDVSAAIAAARGRTFVDKDAIPANGCVMGAHAESVVRMGDLMSEGAMAFADGELTPAEITQLDRKLAAAMDHMGEYRRILADAKGRGGLKVVG
jgi:hypothetical protein